MCVCRGVGWGGEGGSNTTTDGMEQVSLEPGYGTKTSRCEQRGSYVPTIGWRNVIGGGGGGGGGVSWEQVG